MYITNSTIHACLRLETDTCIRFLDIQYNYLVVTIGCSLKSKELLYGEEMQRRSSSTIIIVGFTVCRIGSQAD